MEVGERPDVCESFRVVAASANDIGGDVAIKRQIFVECNAERLDCWTERNFDSSDVDPSRRLKSVSPCTSSEQNCFRLVRAEKPPVLREPACDIADAMRHNIKR